MTVGLAAAVFGESLGGAARRRRLGSRRRGRRPVAAPACEIRRRRHARGPGQRQLRPLRREGAGRPSSSTIFLLPRVLGDCLTPGCGTTPDCSPNSAAAGLTAITLRNLRHSSVSRMRAAGIPAVVAAWHGHSKRMTQSVYGRVSDDSRAALASQARPVSAPAGALRWIAHAGLDRSREFGHSDCERIVGARCGSPSWPSPAWPTSPPGWPCCAGRCGSGRRWRGPPEWRLWRSGPAVSPTTGPSRHGLSSPTTGPSSPRERCTP